MNKNRINTVRRIVMCVLSSALLVVYLSGCGKKTAYYVDAESVVTENEELLSEEIPLPSESDPILLYIYVCGEIQNPGVYQMPEGSRVCDVFVEAGGLTKKAAADYWNQARLLVDGEMIYVPTQEEAEERIPEAQSGSAEEKGSDGKININTASKEMLMQIPGIGESKALAIIAYRQEHGSFSEIEDVMQVEGIKDGVFAKMKDYIVVN